MQHRLRTKMRSSIRYARNMVTLHYTLLEKSSFILLCTSVHFWKSSSFNLTQVVSEPTCVSNNTSTLIDLVLYHQLSLCSHVLLFPLANVDHFGLQLMFTTSQTLDKVYYKEIKVWHYSLAEFDRAAELLESVDWDSLLPQDDVNTYWSAWKNYFMCRSWKSVFLTVWSRLTGTYLG